MYLFRKVLESGGLAAAARLLGGTKSNLARRVAELATRLGLPPYHRDSRNFGITNFGSEYDQRCVRLANEADKVVRKADMRGGFYVIAGERTRLALEYRGELGEIAFDFPVDVKVRDGAYAA
ncbi:LysR family transcriptional regulator [Rhizobium sp. C1]|uniref:LysR family transcriptional regulator n=1 Tax=Rhizobium sp. C1 TaxID=1349799 RepID=UPI001E45A2F7|nr:LysR family transcriptional regulator [Rhizobium sp. C1]MCD2178777.1 LysR family transcriptional regulator [Rhizobium sp. C1]